MKNKLTKLFAIAALALATSFSSSAQVVEEGTSHVFLGYGAPNFPGLLFTALGSGSGGSSIGPLVLSYQYGIKDKISIGGQIGYCSATSPSLTGVDANFKATSYTYSMSLINIMAVGNYHYLESDRADLYSGLGVGYGIITTSTDGNPGVGPTAIPTIAGTTYQLNLLGFRYMFSDNIGAYTELGFGLNGLAQVGLSAKF